MSAFCSFFRLLSQNMNDKYVEVWTLIWKVVDRCRNCRGGVVFTVGSRRTLSSGSSHSVLVPTSDARGATSTRQTAATTQFLSLHSATLRCYDHSPLRKRCQRNWVYAKREFVDGDFTWNCYSCSCSQSLSLKGSCKDLCKPNCLMVIKIVDKYPNFRWTHQVLNDRLSTVS